MHHRHNFLYTRVQRDLDAIPGEVKALIFGTFVFMLAWGIIEPFFSIFLHQVTQDYAITGLLYGAFFLIGIVFSAPAGDLAGKINKTRHTTISMLAYPFLGVLYLSSAFVSGGLSLAVLFFARILNGFSALFWIMTEAFIRENSPKGKTSATFGLYITTFRFAYVLAPLFVFPAVVFFGLAAESIHWLLLALIPFPIAAAVIVSRIRSQGLPFLEGIEEVIVKDRVVKKELADLREMGFVGMFTLLMGFFMMSIQSTVMFLVPLYALSLGLGIIEISVLFALINVPFLFSFFLAELSDSVGKARMIAGGFALAGLALLAISFSSAAPAFLFAACFCLGLILAILQPAVNGIITDITPRIQDGEITGLFTAVVQLSGFLSAVTLGLLANAFGLQFPFIVFAFLLFCMACLTLSIKSRIVVRI